MENNETINPGDIVRCIRGPETKNHPRLIVGNLYTVYDIYQCTNCQAVSFNVGLAAIVDRLRDTTCNCGTDLNGPKGIHLCAADRFVKDKRDTHVRVEVKPISYTKVIEKERERIFEN